MGGGGKPPLPFPSFMRAICIINGGSAHLPFLKIQDAKGANRTFVYSPIHRAHLWDRGELGPEDSADLEAILSVPNKIYIPIVRILRDPIQETETKGSHLPAIEAYMTAEKVFSRDPSDFQDKDSNKIDDRLEQPKKRGRPRKNP
jgi:hypothetical protein